MGPARDHLGRLWRPTWTRQDRSCARLCACRGCSHSRVLGPEPEASGLEGPLPVLQEHLPAQYVPSSSISAPSPFDLTLVSVCPSLSVLSAEATRDNVDGDNARGEMSAYGSGKAWDFSSGVQSERGKKARKTFGEPQEKANKCMSCLSPFPSPELTYLPSSCSLCRSQEAASGQVRCCHHEPVEKVYALAALTSTHYSADDAPILCSRLCGVELSEELVLFVRPHPHRPLPLLRLADLPLAVSRLASAQGRPEVQSNVYGQLLQLRECGQS